LVFIGTREFLIVKKYIFMLAALLLCACAHTTKTSLYDRLGEYEGIDNLVVELIHVIAEDERVKPRYKGVNMEKFRKGLSDYICTLAQGPCHYSGDSIYDVHAGHQYSNTEFNAIVGDLIIAMERKHIPTGTQNELLALLASSYNDVVYH
jgi:hemoglobin